MRAPACKKPARIALYEVSGKFVKEFVSGSKQFVLQAKGLQNGIYLLRAESQGRKLSKKILIQK